MVASPPFELTKIGQHMRLWEHAPSFWMLHKRVPVQPPVHHLRKFYFIPMLPILLFNNFYSKSFA